MARSGVTAASGDKRNTGDTLAEQMEVLDQRRVRRAFARAMPAAGADGLVQQTAAELLDRLAPVRITPETVIDVGCGHGGMTRGLERLYRRAQVIGVDFAPELLPTVRGRRLFGRRLLAVGGDMRRLPLADASVDLVVSNLALPWIDDLPQVFREWRRVLRPEGVLMFSAFGPDSLAELRAAWSEVDAYAHVHDFADMHDIGDAMLDAGLRDPVMDVDRITQDYPDLLRLLQGVRTVGVTNARPSRRRGLVGRDAWQRLQAAYPRSAEAGTWPLSWEVVYGHAWGASHARSGHGNAQEFHVPIDSIGRKSTNNAER